MPWCRSWTGMLFRVTKTACLRLSCMPQSRRFTFGTPAAAPRRGTTWRGSIPSMEVVRFELLAEQGLGTGRGSPVLVREEKFNPTAPAQRCGGERI